MDKNPDDVTLDPVFKKLEPGKIRGFKKLELYQKTLIFQQNSGKGLDKIIRMWYNKRLKINEL